jgi:hypothetical protein
MPLSTLFDVVCDVCGASTQVRLEMLPHGWIAQEMPPPWYVVVREDSYHGDVVAMCSPDCKAIMDAQERLEARSSNSTVIGGSKQ